MEIKERIKMYEKMIMDEKMHLNNAGKSYSPTLHYLNEMLKYEYKKLEEEKNV